MDSKALKAALSRVDDRATGTRYGEDVRSAAVEYLEQRKAEGVSGAEVARELGLQIQTLQRWAKAAGERPVFRRVEVQPAQAPARLTVHAGPLRIEGLDLDGVIELVRRLS